MDTTKVLIIGAVVIVLGGISWVAFSQGKGGDAMMEDKTMMQNDDSAMMEKKDDGAMTKDEGAMMEKKDGAMMAQ